MLSDRDSIHRFTFDQFLEAYDTFSRAAETKALKVVIAHSTEDGVLRDGLDAQVA